MVFWIEVAFYQLHLANIWFCQRFERTLWWNMSESNSYEQMALQNLLSANKNASYISNGTSGSDWDKQMTRVSPIKRGSFESVEIELVPESSWNEQEQVSSLFDFKKVLPFSNIARIRLACSTSTSPSKKGFDSPTKERILKSWGTEFHWRCKFTFRFQKTN